jgi:hypothetical protein
MLAQLMRKKSSALTVNVGSTAFRVQALKKQ